MTYSTFIVHKTDGTKFEVEAIHHRHAYQIALRHCKSEEIQNIYAKAVREPVSQDPRTRAQVTAIKVMQKMEKELNE